MRQRTLRNLGRHVALPRGDGPALCARVERILAPQRSLELGACYAAVEAQRSAAQLVQAGVSPVGPAAPADGADDPSAALPRVDVDSLELVPVVRQRLRAGRRPAGRRCAVAWRASSG